MGTGACAVVAASARLGKCDFGTSVCVNLLGGELDIVCNEDYSITMNGKAETVYDGVISIPDEFI